MKGITYTDEFLISEIKRFVEENGRLPTQRDFVTSDKFPCATTYNTHFGNWANAIRKVDPTYKTRKEKFQEKVPTIIKMIKKGCSNTEIKKTLHCDYMKVRDVRNKLKEGEINE